jgi:hypothetical protein
VGRRSGIRASVEARLAADEGQEANSRNGPDPAPDSSTPTTVARPQDAAVPIRLRGRAEGALLRVSA